MIQLNFIENEIVNARKQRTFMQGILAYVILWLFSVSLIWVNFIGRQAEMQTLSKELAKVQGKILQTKPALLNAIRLYKTRDALKKEISEKHKETVTTAFILENLHGLMRSVPENMWITNFTIEGSSVEQKKGKKDKIYQNEALTKIRANVVLDLDKNNSTEVIDFKRSLQQQPPFSQAECELLLDNVSLFRDSLVYYHDFEMVFNYPEMSVL